MTLLAKPQGRGNWRPLTIKLDGPLLGAIVIRPGERITLGGVIYRICEVRP